ncbi:hypothetical protein GCM10010254_41350 [Streptomyces chromofuscus]|nr:hypothetical protein GCM10010254_41350 [Streptomyces chromofuscus]
MTASAAPAFREAGLRETPLGRPGTVDDVAPPVVFLLSDESSFITGADIPVDSGPTAHGGSSPSPTPGVRPCLNGALTALLRLGDTWDEVVTKMQGNEPRASRVVDDTTTVKRRTHDTLGET